MMGLWHKRDAGLPVAVQTLKSFPRECMAWNASAHFACEAKVETQKRAGNAAVAEWSLNYCSSSMHGTLLLGYCERLRYLTVALKLERTFQRLWMCESRAAIYLGCLLALSERLSQVQQTASIFGQEKANHITKKPGDNSR